MGNACSVVRYAIDYVLRYILPGYTSYFPVGYDALIAQDIVSAEDSAITQESENLSLKDHESSIKIGDQNCDYSNHEIRGNNYLLDIVSSFFKNYNFQMQVLSGTTYEKNLRNKRQYDEKQSWNLQVSNEDGVIKESRFAQQHWNTSQEDFISGFNDIKIDATKSNSGNENIDEQNQIDICVQNDRPSTKEHFHGTESSNENDKIVTKSNLNLSSNLRKYGMTLTDDILRRREQLARRSFSHVDRGGSNDQNSNDSRSTDRQVSEKKRPQVRKLSLQRMHSGCHYSVDDGNDSVKLTDYSRESPPLIVSVESYTNMCNPNLCSGGLVAFKELSKHLSIPNYYAENPIVYNELPQGTQFPRTQPLELPSQEPRVRPTSCSGGGLVPDSIRRVSLPDIFPERDSLLQAVSSEGSTKDLSSRVTEGEEIIFSDLISESLRYDALLASQMAEETHTQPRREISCHASETEDLAVVSQRCADDNRTLN